MTDIEHCEACGQPVREWSGRRNDYIGLSTMWAKRAHAAEADGEALAHAVSASLTHGEQSPLAKALSEYLAKHPWSDL